MNAWEETVGVVLIAVGSAFAGRWFSRLPRPWWTLGYFIPMVFVVLTSLARWFAPLQFIPPFSWLVSGRTAFVIVGIITPMVLTTPLSRLPGKRLKTLVMLFLGAAVIQYSVLPFLHPALAYRQLAALETIIDTDGVCPQGTDYTCGPAAAVTALRRLGLPRMNRNWPSLRTPAGRLGRRPTSSLTHCGGAINPRAYGASPVALIRSPT